MNRESSAAPELVSEFRRSVHLSSEMVAAFASLTGDRSSLHVDAAFARRSAYRQPIVHGMLPLAFLATSTALGISGRRAVPLALSGRFLSPIYIGDDVTLITAAGQASDGGDAIDVPYRVERERSGTAATVGTLTVGYQQHSGSVPQASGGLDGLLAVPPSLSDLTLEQIVPGMTDTLRFIATPGAVDALARLLVAGGAETTVDELTSRLHVPTFLAYLLFSTSVGVSLPGVHATFLEFAARASVPLEGNREYALVGRISHRSKSTRIIRKDLSVVASGTDDPPVL